MVSTAVPRDLNQFLFYSDYLVPTQKKIQSGIMVTGYGLIKQVITGISERLHETFWYCFSSLFVQTPLEGSTLWAHTKGVYGEVLKGQVERNYAFNMHLCKHTPQNKQLRKGSQYEVRAWINVLVD